MQIGHVGGAVSSPSNTKSPGYAGLQSRTEKSEELIHQFLQVGDIPQPDLPDFGLGSVSVSPGRKYSPEFVKLLQQIAADPKLNYDLKKKLFKTAYSLVAAPGMVSHHHILGLPGNPKSYSVFRSGWSGRSSDSSGHHEDPQR